MDLEGFDAELRVEFSAFLQAGVDYEADAGDGDGGFGDVGCEDDFAAARWCCGECFVLQILGESCV